MHKYNCGNGNLLNIKKLKDKIRGDIFHASLILFAGMISCGKIFWFKGRKNCCTTKGKQFLKKNSLGHNWYLNFYHQKINFLRLHHLVSARDAALVLTGWGFRGWRQRSLDEWNTCHCTALPVETVAWQHGDLLKAHSGTWGICWNWL